MALIEVTATVRYSYDTDDGMVQTHDDAREDVEDMLNSGDVLAHNFEITVRTV